ncbi:MAG: hypothetical protein FWG77_06765 [Treponema sp.]|nr:hypothetical protein [Treponema sp.]
MGDNMGIAGVSFTGSYLEYLPANKIMKYIGNAPKGGTKFKGYPQQHPTDKNKLILVNDPLGESPAVLEFKLDDVIYVEDAPKAVTEKGEGIPLVILWIRRGARGMLLEPFEVNDSLDFIEVRKELRERFEK